MSEEDEVRRRFQAFLADLSGRRAPVRHLRTASRLAVPQPATMAVFTKMSEACGYRCGQHRNCCAHPGKQVQQNEGSCQFAHCPLMGDIIHA